MNLVLRPSLRRRPTLSEWIDHTKEQNKVSISPMKLLVMTSSVSALSTTITSSLYDNKLLDSHCAEEEITESSTTSLSLNIFLNHHRHLAFSLACILQLILLYRKPKKTWKGKSTMRVFYSGLKQDH